MCGGYGNEDSNNDGKVSIGDFFTDITDGGGAGRSGARFSSGDTSVLDDNNDRYVSEAEYMRGQLASEANDAKGGYGRFGDAYNDAQTGISTFSNAFGALPRGSIRQEAALGPQYGSPIETKNMARYLQMGGMPGAAIRGVSGFLNPAINDARNMAMAPVRAYRGEGAPPKPVVTPEQAARSYDSIFNTGARTVPQDVIEGTRSLNPRLGRPMAMPAPVDVGYDDDPILYNQIMGAYDNEEFSNPFAVNVSTMPNYDIRKVSDNNSGGKYAVTGTNPDGTAVNGEFDGEYLMENGFIK